MDARFFLAQRRSPPSLACPAAGYSHGSARFASFPSARRASFGGTACGASSAAGRTACAASSPPAGTWIAAPAPVSSSGSVANRIGSSRASRAHGPRDGMGRDGRLRGSGGGALLLLLLDEMPDVWTFVAARRSPPFPRTLSVFADWHASPFPARGAPPSGGLPTELRASLVGPSACAASSPPAGYRGLRRPRCLPCEAPRRSDRVVSCRPSARPR
ncbi:hypothetical protein DFJ74DRAFT_78003 [Hyaloraphidium curvatum]|nr:hypothetical protein DFJ74DRAFT_78003 [Hyaloraphidium curvatum]